MTILVDASVWIDFFNGSPSPEAIFLRENLGRRRFIVGDLILAEVLQGFRQQTHFTVAADAMQKFPVVSLVGQRMAVLSARNYRYLRSQGVTIRSTIDCLVASFCIANEISLLHSDRDYSNFEQLLRLKVLHP